MTSCEGVTHINKSSATWFQSVTTQYWKINVTHIFTRLKKNGGENKWDVNKHSQLGDAKPHTCQILRRGYDNKNRGVNCTDSTINFCNCHY